MERCVVHTQLELAQLQDFKINNFYKTEKDINSPYYVPGPVILSIHLYSRSKSHTLHSFLSEETETLRCKLMNTPEPINLDLLRTYNGTRNEEKTEA